MRDVHEASVHSAAAPGPVWCCCGDLSTRPALLRQVTKDGVPVLWHDDTVVWRQPDGSTTSADIADLMLPEFSSLLVRC